jgi:hypothetical protein
MIPIMDFFISSSVTFSFDDLLFGAMAVVLLLMLEIVSGTSLRTKSWLYLREVARLLDSRNSSA